MSPGTARLPARPRSRARRVVLGITGSIAAYKSAELVRGLVKSGAEVRCVMTPTAEKFIAPLTLSVLSKNPVHLSLHETSLWEMAHLSLGDWADLIVVAPATADFIARLAAGRAEGLLDALALAAKDKMAVAPAMDAEMWEHPATQANVSRIKSYGCRVWGPVRGELASGKTGWGRLLDIDEIVRLSLAR